VGLDIGAISSSNSAVLRFGLFALVGVPHQCPLPSSPLLRLIDQQRMAPEYFYRKKHFLITLIQMFVHNFNTK
jgi:hypothetical protein